MVRKWLEPAIPIVNSRCIKILILCNIYIAGTSLSKLSANENFASAPSYHQNISRERHLDYNYMEDGQRNSYYCDRTYESKLNSHADDVGNGKFFCSKYAIKNRTFNRLSLCEVHKVVAKNKPY